jgi:hypothetical protein
VKVVAYDDDVEWADSTWRNSAVAEDCAALCYISDMLFASDPASDVGQMIQALDSAQRPLVAFAGAINYPGTNIKLHLSPTNDPCSGGITACATTNQDIYVFSTRTRQGTTPPHEVGHLLQKKEFNNTNDLVDDCSSGGSTHAMDSIEFDSCATQEGWADYVSIVSWWDPNDADSRPSKQGFDAEEANPEGSSCVQASGMEGQVMRGFWDLDDNNNEGAQGEASGDDDASSSTTNLLDHWGEFDAGEGDRQFHEDDFNGVNVFDYEYNAGLNATQSEAFIDHNCLQWQEQ